MEFEIGDKVMVMKDHDQIPHGTIGTINYCYVYCAQIDFGLLGYDCFDYGDLLKVHKVEKYTYVKKSNLLLLLC